MIRFGKSRRAADPGEAGRAAHRNRHARNLVRIEDQRQSLAAAVRAAQDAPPSPMQRTARRGGQRRSCRAGRWNWCAPCSPPPQKRRSRPKNCPRKLEQIARAGPQLLAARRHPRSWPTSFLECADGRKKSPAFEARWLNLGGFCLRPGFGFPGDDFRIEQARRIYAGGLQYRQPGAERNRLVDLLGPRRRRAESQSAGRHLPAPCRLPAAARRQEAAAHQQQPAARDVAHRVEPGTAAHPDEDRTRRCAGRVA